MSAKFRTKQCAKITAHIANGLDHWIPSITRAMATSQKSMG